MKGTMITESTLAHPLQHLAENSRQGRKQQRLPTAPLNNSGTQQAVQLLGLYFSYVLTPCSVPQLVGMSFSKFSTMFSSPKNQTGLVTYSEFGPNERLKVSLKLAKPLTFQAQPAVVNAMYITATLAIGKNTETSSARANTLVLCTIQPIKMEKQKRCLYYAKGLLIASFGNGTTC